jgi:hypothetical protein
MLLTYHELIMCAAPVIVIIMIVLKCVVKFEDRVRKYHVVPFIINLMVEYS